MLRRGITRWRVRVRGRTQTALSMHDGDTACFSTEDTAATYYTDVSAGGMGKVEPNAAAMAS